MLDIGSPSSEAASFFSSIGSTGFVPDCKFSIKVIKTAISADLVSSIAYFTNSYSKPISISSFEAVAISYGCLKLFFQYISVNQQNGGYNKIETRK